MAYVNHSDDDDVLLNLVYDPELTASRRPAASQFVKQSLADLMRVRGRLRFHRHRGAARLPYDADDPLWLRRNYATVVWGIATAHEIYHPRPLRGTELDRHYGEFVRVGHALGGTDLPATKADTLNCLEEYLPRVALTRGNARCQPHQSAAGGGGLGDPRHHTGVGGAARPAS